MPSAAQNGRQKMATEKTQITPTKEEIAISEIILSGSYKRLLVLGVDENNKFFLHNPSNIDSDAYGLMESAECYYSEKRMRAFEDDLDDTDY